MALEDWLATENDIQVTADGFSLYLPSSSFFPNTAPISSSLRRQKQERCISIFSCRFDVFLSYMNNNNKQLSLEAYYDVPDLKIWRHY